MIALEDRLLERFLRYTAIGTQSDHAKADSGNFPSSENQRAFARVLADELASIGIADVRVDENCYVLARVPATAGFEAKPPFGLSAHMDTASDAPGDGVKPIAHKGWDGSRIELPGGFAIDPVADAEIAACAERARATGKPDTIITSDGTTLLGADDKAGIAGIVTLAEHLVLHPEIPHGPIEIMFSPDEETGHGMDRVPLAALSSRAFYTVDGGALGEIESECFNAWKAEILFTGVAAHLGSARGKMVNAVSMAADFACALPSRESPETTDGYLGYFCPLEIAGSSEEARLTVFLRDFDRAGMERRLARLDGIAEGIRARYPGGKIALTKTEQYRNMKEKIDAEPEVLDRLKEAASRAGVDPRMKPIRGGTDGSRLTELGIPTPNVFTGGHNYHSRTEWASLSEMAAMVRTLIELAKIWGER
jgi:tripeptide aminopeptidase